MGFFFCSLALLDRGTPLLISERPGPANNQAKPQSKPGPYTEIYEKERARPKRSGKKSRCKRLRVHVYSVYIHIAYT